MRVLVMGVTGMLGHQVFDVLAKTQGVDVYGTMRSYNNDGDCRQIIEGVEAQNESTIDMAFDRVSPHVVINCIGIVKQTQAAKDPISVIRLNGLMPHYVAKKCAEFDARLIHFSTDCVFSGTKGLYTEDDLPDPVDLYGRSKLVGELDGEKTLTLRTSIIGPELRGSHSLLEWFLAQEKSVNGFTKAVFSGLPTVELARIIRDYLLFSSLAGVYHLSAAPITKYDLLSLIRRQYGKDIAIAPCDTPVIDRSLDSSRFQKITGYKPPQWDSLIRQMHSAHMRKGEL